MNLPSVFNSHVPWERNWYRMFWLSYTFRNIPVLNYVLALSFLSPSTDFCKIGHCTFYCWLSLPTILYFFVFIYLTHAKYPRLSVQCSQRPLCNWRE